MLDSDAFVQRDHSFAREKVHKSSLNQQLDGSPNKWITRAPHG